MLFVNIDRKSNETLSQQIFHSIKDSILQDKLQSQEKLPSTRELAKYLNVSRNVVIESYEQLLAEGYIYSQSGSGTYVCEGVQFHQLNKSDFQTKNKSHETHSKNIISFRSGIPDLEAIPIKKWAQIYQKNAMDIKPSQMDYQSSFGDYELRTQLSLYLNRARGVETSPENILITNGAAQSFNLLCKLIKGSEYAIVENPISYGILHTLKGNSVKIKPISIDKNGLITSDLPDDSPKLIFTTPSHQFPTGVIFPVKRRIELIKYAEQHNSYIVEDDYDSEYRFDGSPIQSMQFLNPERVIYVGSFSKTLMPGLRIGLMVLPKILCEEMREIKYVADYHSPTLEQLTLAKFIESGLFENHIRKMRKLYLKKRNFLISCLKKTFGERVDISGAETGLHLIASFDDVSFNKELLEKIKNSGVEISSVKKHYLSAEISTPYDNSLIFGYGNTKIDDMEKGIEIIYSLINNK